MATGTNVSGVAGAKGGIQYIPSYAENIPTAPTTALNRPVGSLVFAVDARVLYLCTNQTTTSTLTTTTWMNLTSPSFDVITANVVIAKEYTAPAGDQLTLVSPNGTNAAWRLGDDAGANFLTFADLNGDGVAQLTSAGAFGAASFDSTYGVTGTEGVFWEGNTFTANGSATNVDIKFVAKGTGAVSHVRSYVGGTVTLAAANTDNTNTASHAQVLMQSGGTSGGNPKATWTIPGGASWVMGINNSVGDQLQLSRSTTLGTNNLFVVNTTSQITWTPNLYQVTTSGNVAGAFGVTTNAGASETMVFTNTQGTSNAAIALTATVGGLTFTATNKVGDNAINFSAPAGGMNVDLATQFNVTSTQAASNAIALIASHAAGGIECQVGTGNFNVIGATVATTTATAQSFIANGDEGTGVVSTVMYTNVVDETVSTGAGTILMKTANPGNSSGWLKIYNGTSVRYIPYFTTIDP